MFEVLTSDFLGGGVVDSLCHFFSSGVASKGNILILLQRWVPPVVLIRYIVLVVGDWLQLWCLILNKFFAPSRLASLQPVRPL